MPDNQISSHQS